MAEGEFAGIRNLLPNMIWARMFLDTQGFSLDTNNLMYQDNQSPIQVAKNGEPSHGAKTKHMDIWYFWIKDRLQSESIDLQYCPTEVMLGDFFTKLLGIFSRNLERLS